MNKTRFKGAGVQADNWKYGSTVLTGGGTFLSGLTSVDQVIASLDKIGTAAGDPWVMSATASGGTIIVSIRQDDGTLAANPVQVHWIAVGTP